MKANELFRLMSLRQAKVSGQQGTPEDSRLRHRERINAQSGVETPRREAHLARLQARHKEVSLKVRDLESVQRAVVKAAMLREMQASSKPRASAPEDRASIARAAATDVNAERSSAASAISIDAPLKRDIAARLSEREATLFHETLARMPGGEVADLDDILNGLDVSAFYEEANRICHEIQATRVAIGDAWPTINANATGERPPVVSAVGWGELVVARETLVGYDAREIAHIENVLPGETKFREHERNAKTEEVEEVETVSERETEKDSQTTDRYELQSETQETIQRDFSVAAGVNTSGRYGVTQVDTSLDTAFAQSQSQSRSTAINTAQEIVTKSLERTFERVRKMRRLTVTEEIRELNRHELKNVGTAPLSSISGMYLWVEKVQEIELRHFGTRMMLEFHVPEPAISLLESAAGGGTRMRLPPFDVGPQDVDGTNYLCLAQQFGAVDVQPPPPQFIKVGFGWVSTLNEEAENWAEDQFTDMINVPDGYSPEWARVAWSGLQGKLENREFNFAFAVGGVSEPPATKEHFATTWNGVVLQLPAGVVWPQGVPVSGRVRGSWDGAMYVHVTLSCRRTNDAYDKWRIATWGSLRAGYEALVRQFAQQQQAEAFETQSFGGNGDEQPAEVNRKIEREELQKWAIKSLRLVPQNLNAIERVGVSQEMSPLQAEAEAPVVRFYESAFEWDLMSYFLYPYHWGRRESWEARRKLRRIDSRFQAFLQSGAARVIVPVTPGFEDKVLSFLDPENPADELTRILAPPRISPPSGASNFRDLWVELLTEHKPDVARGSGTLAVTQGSADVRINGDSRWRATSRDLGRELRIAGEQYTIVEVTDAAEFRLDRPLETASDPAAVYVAGSVPFGPSWRVNVPTTLVVLAENLPALRSLGSNGNG